MSGARKIVFASGAPHTDPSAVLAMVEEAGLGADEKEKIFHGNAQRLFGWRTGLGDGELTAGVPLTPMGG